MTFAEVFGSEKESFDDVLDMDFIETRDDRYRTHSDDYEPENATDEAREASSNTESEIDDAARFLALVEGAQAPADSTLQPPAPPELVARTPVFAPPSTNSMDHSSLLRWERVPEMESHVGLTLERATCRWQRQENGEIAIDIIAQLKRQDDAGPAGADAYLRLTAVAEDSAGNFLAWEMRNIPQWDEFPPLYIVGDFRVVVPELPSRFRLYPEVN